MNPALLYLLAVLDGAFSGYRAATGRNPAVHKQRYYYAAFATGALASQLGMFVTGLFAWLILRTTQKPYALESDWNAAAEIMVGVYGVYAGLVISALLAWLVPRRELRGLATVLVLGPGTLVRPLVIAAGVLAGTIARPRWEVVSVAALGGAAVLAVEGLLSLYQARNQRVREGQKRVQD